MTSSRPDNNPTINKYVLIRTYKKIKRQPDRIFMAKDFNFGNTRMFRTKYLNTLAHLNLIEVKNTVWITGRNSKARRNGYGYKLKPSS